MNINSAMLQRFGRLDRTSIEAAMRIAERLRQRGQYAEYADAEVLAAVERAEAEARQQAQGLALMDKVGAE